MKNKVIAIFIAILMCLSICTLMPAEANETVYGTGAIDETLEEFAERSGTQLIDVSSQVATASVLPSSVDLSTDTAFPCIDTQGSIGSCTAWATTYYQFTYEVNKLRNAAAKELVNGEYVNINENVYSPTWTYNYINGGADNGSKTSDAYRVLRYQGAMNLADMPYDVSSYDFDEWSDDIEKLTEALKYRITYSTYYGSNTSNITKIKEQLANGHVGVITTYSKGWVIEQNSDGEYAIVCGSSDGGHAVAVVGYDDNFQITVNGVTLTGAFKLANSWGENYSKHNNGYIWVAYDALNATSSHGTAWQNGLKTRVGNAYDSSMRVEIFKANNPVTFATAYECDVTFAGYAEYVSTQKYDISIYAADSSSVTKSNSYKKWDCEILNSKTAASYTTPPKILVFDFFAPGTTVNVGDYLTSNWTILLDDTSTSGTETIAMRTRVIDNFGNMIAPNTYSYTNLTESELSITMPVNLAKGRLSAYDNAEITSDDADILLNYLTEATELSNIQIYLADYNEDGSVSMIDLVYMNRYLEEQNGETYAITDYVDRWGCSLADIIEEEYSIPVEQYIAENYAELSAIDAVPTELELY